MGAGGAGRFAVEAITLAGIFQADNVAQDLAPTQMNVTGGGAGRVVMPDAGRIFGVTVLLSELVTAGNLEIRPAIDGAAAGVVFITPGFGLRGFIPMSSFVVGGEAPFTVGQDVGALVGSDAAFTPITLDFTVLVWVALNRGRMPAG